jgi:hypothetical protein
MHRRTLILRRFGPLSFGLGYVENGIWVDHAVAIARGEDLLTSASPADRAAIDAVHAWFDCCGGAITSAQERIPAIAGSASS